MHPNLKERLRRFRTRATKKTRSVKNCRAVAHAAFLGHTSGGGERPPNRRHFSETRDPSVIPACSSEGRGTGKKKDTGHGNSTNISNGNTGSTVCKKGMTSCTYSHDCTVRKSFDSDSSRTHDAGPANAGFSDFLPRSPDTQQRMRLPAPISPRYHPGQHCTYSLRDLAKQSVWQLRLQLRELHLCPLPFQAHYLRDEKLEAGQHGKGALAIQQPHRNHPSPSTRQK